MSMRMPILLIPTLLALLCIPPAGAIEQDELNIRMWYLKKIEQGDSDGVMLHVSALNQRHAIKINWTGLHLDWQPEDEYFENTTQFDLGRGQSVMIGLYVACPRDTPLGMHSDYLLIEYLVQDGPNASWNERFWMSDETADFEVVAAPRGASTAGPGSSFPTDPVVCGVLIVISIVIIIARSIIIKKSSRPKPYYPPPGAYPGLHPWPQNGPPYGQAQATYGQPQAAQYQAATPPGLSPATPARPCPYCGASASGGYCRSCGHLIWD